MSSSIGHVLGAAAAHRTFRCLAPADAPRGTRALLLIAALAALPDADIIWGWCQGSATAFHRGITHSVLFAAAFALLGNLVWYHSLGAFRNVRAALALFGACLVHPLLDYLMGCGDAMPLLAPFSWRGFQAPRQFVPTAYYAERVSDLPKVFTNRDHLWTMAIELWIFVPLFVAARPGRSWLVRAPLLLLSASALVTTYILYN